MVVAYHHTDNIVGITGTANIARAKYKGTVRHSPLSDLGLDGPRQDIPMAHPSLMATISSSDLCQLILFVCLLWTKEWIISAQIYGQKIL